MELSVQALQVILDVTYYVVFHAVKALTFFMQRDSYLYWPFLVSYVAIALAVARGWRRFGSYFDRRLWWHKSARADYVVYFANALLMPVLFGYLLMNEPQFPTAGAEPAGILARIVFTLLFFIAYDFGRFAAHCLLHDVPALWEFHKVHHSAQVLTPMTSYRAHPLELLLMAWGSVATTALLTWIFNLVVPGTISFYSFLGLHVLMWAINLIDNLRHSPVWLSYGPRVGRWLISPAHHQLHHSYEPRHFGRNRGFTIALWDRLYGTLYVPPFQVESFRLGLGDGTEERYHGLWPMYWLPFAGVARLKSRDAKSLFDRRDNAGRAP